MLSIEQCLVATVAIGLVTYFTRAFPFLLFSKRQPPKFIEKIVQFLPPLLIAILVTYCFNDIPHFASLQTLYYVICIGVCIVLHLTLKNSMISIFGSTVLYMILIRLFGK